MNFAKSIRRRCECKVLYKEKEQKCTSRTSLLSLSPPLASPLPSMLRATSRASRPARSTASLAAAASLGSAASAPRPSLSALVLLRTRQRRSALRRLAALPKTVVAALSTSLSASKSGMICNVLYVFRF